MFELLFEFKNFKVGAWRLMGTDGSRFMYTCVFDGDKWYYYFCERGSDPFGLGTFSPDGKTATGRWT